MSAPIYNGMLGITKVSVYLILTNIMDGNFPYKLYRSEFYFLYLFINV